MDSLVAVQSVDFYSAVGMKWHIWHFDPGKRLEKTSQCNQTSAVDKPLFPYSSSSAICMNICSSEAVFTIHSERTLSAFSLSSCENRVLSLTLSLGMLKNMCLYSPAENVYCKVACGKIEQNCESDIPVEFDWPEKNRSKTRLETKLKNQIQTSKFQIEKF